MFKVMATREWVPWYGLFTQLKLPSFLSDAGVLKREEMNNDVERIKEVLLNKGYLNAQVGLPAVELSEDKKWFVVTYAVLGRRTVHGRRSGIPGEYGIRRAGTS